MLIGIEIDGKGLHYLISISFNAYQVTVLDYTCALAWLTVAVNTSFLLHQVSFFVRR